MLELKSSIYHRAASLSSQASSVDVCSIGQRITDQASVNSNTKSTMDDKASRGLRNSIHTDCISNPVILGNNNLSFAKCFVCMCTSEENGAAKEAIFLQ